MNKKDLQRLDHILSQPRFSHSKLLELWRAEAKVTEDEPKGTRSSQQNRALHMWLSQVADALNEAGMPMQKVLTVDIEWNQDSVKEYLWRTVQKSLLKKDSTTQLSKLEVTRVYEALNRLLGEKWGIHIPFPSQEHRSDLLDGMDIDIRGTDAYPDDYKEPLL